MEKETAHIFDMVKKLIAFDPAEQEHINGALEWIKSGAPLFRIQKPRIPDKHLVSYFVLFDWKVSKVLLTDHRKSQLGLPTGGHVEINEDPKETVRRECDEELGIAPDFWKEEPIFITSTLTVGLDQHIDVSFWYVLKGNVNHSYDFDETEFKDIRWFSFDEIPYEKSDPHMKRFIEKLKTFLS